MVVVWVPREEVAGLEREVQVDAEEEEMQVTQHQASEGGGLEPWGPKRQWSPWLGGLQKHKEGPNWRRNLPVLLPKRAPDLLRKGEQMPLAGRRKKPTTGKN